MLLARTRETAERPRRARSRRRSTPRAGRTARAARSTPPRIPACCSPTRRSPSPAPGPMSGRYLIAQVTHRSTTPDLPAAVHARAQCALDRRRRERRPARRGVLMERRRPGTADRRALRAGAAALLRQVPRLVQRQQTRAAWAASARGCRRCWMPKSARGRCPACPMPATASATTRFPPVGAAVWIEFEAGDPEPADLDRLLVGRGPSAGRTTRHRGDPATEDHPQRGRADGLAGRRWPGDRRQRRGRQQPAQDRGAAGPDPAAGRDQGRGRGAADRAGRRAPPTRSSSATS